MRRTLTTAIALVTLLTVLAVPAAAGPRTTFPDVIPLPTGFQPEGIVIGNGTDFYVGSLADGSIYKGSVLTGEGEVLVSGEAGGIAVGLAFDGRRNVVWAAGGPVGNVVAYDATTGAKVFEAQLGPGFVNDAIVAHDGLYLTNSFAPELYRLPLTGSSLPDPAAVETIALSGEFEFLPGEFNTNGIETTPDGKGLIIVHSSLGKLYRVDTVSGEATEIDLGPGSVASGDGLVRIGRTLYVVQNFFNQIAEIRLDGGARSGTITDVITDPDFRIPTTADIRGGAIYAVNARFDTAPTPDTEYEVVRVRR